MNFFPEEAEFDFATKKSLMSCTVFFRTEIQNVNRIKERCHSSLLGKL